VLRVADRLRSPQHRAEGDREALELVVERHGTP
jgi:hypothetical protein